MGTTTFFQRLNDCGKALHKMSKKELEELNNTTPYDDKPYNGGWLVPMELNNGNVNVLVFWRGRLMKIEDAPLFSSKATTTGTTASTRSFRRSIFTTAQRISV